MRSHLDAVARLSFEAAAEPTGRAAARCVEGYF
jgi:hypothetical protein